MIKALYIDKSVFCILLLCVRISEFVAEMTFQFFAKSSEFLIRTPDETLHIWKSEKGSGNMLNLIKRVKNELSNKF